MIGIARIENSKLVRLCCNTEDGIKVWNFGFIFGINNENAHEANFSGYYVVDVVRFTTTTRVPYPVVKILTSLQVPYIVSLALLKFGILNAVLPVAEAMFYIDGRHALNLHKILNEKKFTPDERQIAIKVLEQHKDYFDEEDFTYFMDYLNSDDCIAQPTQDTKEVNTEDELSEQSVTYES